MTSRTLVLGGVFALALSTAAAAQPAPAAVPLGKAFMTGLKARIANVQGKLPLNPPSRAQTDAGLVLADPAGPNELKPFADIAPKNRLFAAVNTAGGAEVVIGGDATQNLCRVVVMDAKDLTPVTAAVGPLGGDWTVVQDEPLQNFTVFTGTVLGSPKLTIRIRQPAKGGAYGDAQYMLTLIKPKG